MIVATLLFFLYQIGLMLENYKTDNEVIDFA